MHDYTREIGIVAYALAALACLGAAWRGRRGFWGGLAALHVLLAVEVSSGLRFELTRLFRGVVREEPLRSKLDLQVPALIGVAALLAVAAWLAARSARRRGWNVSVAVLGSGFSLAVFLAEAISLHGSEPVLYLRLGPAVLVGWLWVLGAGLVLAGALRAVIRHPAAVAGSQRMSRGIDTPE